MSNKATINGNEYSYGEIVESEFFDDKSKEIVLNGEVVKVGDVWLTRELDEVLITSINIGCWPIRDNKERTYSVYGIADSSYKISGQDLMSILADTENTEDVNDTEAVNDTENTEDVKDTVAVKDTENTEYVDNGIDALPILDIQIGDVWETSTGERVEIASHNSVGEYKWVSAEGVTYTNKGTYFSNMISPKKDLVTRVIRTTEINELKSTCSSDMPNLIPDIPSYISDDLRCSIIADVDVCSKDTTINFENAVKMHMDSIVSLIGDRICEKVKSRDISTVKYLTKVLEKVIALESL